MSEAPTSSSAWRRAATRCKGWSPVGPMRLQRCAFRRSEFGNDGRRRMPFQAHDPVRHLLAKLFDLIFVVLRHSPIERGGQFGSGAFQNPIRVSIDSPQLSNISPHRRQIKLLAFAASLRLHRSDPPARSMRSRPRAIPDLIRTSCRSLRTSRRSNSPSTRTPASFPSSAGRKG
jgi:hypothetical protein